jgi:hypothetical protein
VIKGIALDYANSAPVKFSDGACEKLRLPLACWPAYTSGAPSHSMQTGNSNAAGNV